MRPTERSSWVRASSTVKRHDPTVTAGCGAASGDGVGGGTGAGGGEGGAASVGVGDGAGAGVGTSGGEGEAASAGVGSSGPGAAGAPPVQDAARTSAKSQPQHCQYLRDAPMSAIRPLRGAVSVPDAPSRRDALACTSPRRGLSLTPQEGSATLGATKSETLRWGAVVRHPAFREPAGGASRRHGLGELAPERRARTGTPRYGLGPAQLGRSPRSQIHRRALGDRTRTQVAPDGGNVNAGERFRAAPSAH